MEVSRTCGKVGRCLGNGGFGQCGGRSQILLLQNDVCGHMWESVLSVVVVLWGRVQSWMVLCLDDCRRMCVRLGTLSIQMV